MGEKHRCRSCGAEGLRPMLDLGMTPLTGAFLKEADLATGPAIEARYPLETAFCGGCTLLQILETIPPEVLFCREYPYYSSFSDDLLRHSRENALGLISSRRLGSESLVVEIASNDGYLLRNFVERGIPCLGIDPAEGQAREAALNGVPTLAVFFGEEQARKIRDEGKAADVIIANNVLAHATDTNGFVEGIRILLKEGGTASIEVPYVRDLIEKCEFDTIYHEHLCYFSVTSLDKLLRRHSLFINEAERIPIHGGSLRILAGHEEKTGPSVVEALESERAAGIDSFGYYADFAARVNKIRETMRKNLLGLKSGGNRIAAYGAAAKGSILLNYTGIGRETIDFVVDRNVHKQGLHMPGVRIPISPPSRLLEERPDYVLILAWNFAGEILRQQEEYVKGGGRFIIPLPEWKVVF